MAVSDGSLWPSLTTETWNASYPQDLTTSTTSGTKALNTTLYNVEIPLAERIVEGTVLIVIFILSVVGNFSLWLVVCLSRDLRTLSNCLLLCLSTADILVSVTNMPLTVYTILVGEWHFSETACTIQGFLNMITFIASVMSLAAISWNRYIAICKPTSLKVYWTRWTTAVVIAVVWVVSLLLACPPLFGWGVYAYLPRQSFCFCDWSTSVSYTFFMVGTCFGGPFISMAICYGNIWKEVRASGRRVGHFDEEYANKPKMDSNYLSPNWKAKQTATITPYKPVEETLTHVGTPKKTTGARTAENLSVSSNVGTNSVSKRPERGKQSRAEKRRQEEIRLVISLFIIVVIFIIAWLPFCVTMFWSVFAPSNPPPRIIDMFTLLLGYANSCCNPIVYGLMNKRFKESFKRLFTCQCRNIYKTSPLSSNSAIDSSNSNMG